MYLPTRVIQHWVTSVKLCIRSGNFILWIVLLQFLRLQIMSLHHLTWLYVIHIMGWFIGCFKDRCIKAQEEVLRLRHKWKAFSKAIYFFLVKTWLVKFRNKIKLQKRHLNKSKILKTIKSNKRDLQRSRRKGFGNIAIQRSKIKHR